MKVNRKRTRKFLLQKLFAMTFSEYNEEMFSESFYDGVFTFDIDNEYSKEMISIIIEKEPYFIYILEKYSPKFNIESMNKLYILPLYVGLAEMFFLKEEIPAKVSINEAVEIAKVYCDDSGKKIVNGVLNKVYENYDELKKSLPSSSPESKYSLFKKIS